MEHQISILEALERKNIFISVRPNRLYESGSSDKRGFRLVLSITADKSEGKTILRKIESGISKADIKIVENIDNSVAHLLLYCKDAVIVEKVLEDSINGHTLRSSTRYVRVDKKELLEKARKSYDFHSKS